ncbi:MAG: PQQ-like beta-propeller repeat protein, partial [Melioribacteraceae bacterium]|nr:PQQ-like beta-propeller repeat protein [Melioribacteraceae bacterium]
LYSLNPSGDLNWKFEFDTQFIMDNTEPTIDSDGNIFFGADTLYSVNYKGILRWKQSLGTKHIFSPLINDKDGNIYIGATELGSPSEQNVISFNNNGEFNWDLKVEGERLLGASPVITSSGKLIFPTFRAFNFLIIY